MHRLVLATRNAHKAREFVQILGPGFSVTDLTGMNDLPEVEENGASFEENAILKALAVSNVLPGLVVSDDSGLEVVALHGAPGVRSARYAGESATDEENVAKLLSEIRAADPGEKERCARFCCTLALADAGKILRTFHGAVNGVIVSGARGERGFGYDPVFAPERYAQTFAELGVNVKNRISHRAEAIARLREYLTSP